MPPKRKGKGGNKPASTTVDQPTADLSKVLTDFVSSGSNSTFTCGGAIPLADMAAARLPGRRAAAASPPLVDEDRPVDKKRKAAGGKRAGGKKRKTAKGKAEAAEPEAASTEQVPEPHPGAIVVRWDRTDGSQGKVTFPVADSNAEDAAAFDALADDCLPAGFGHRGKNVLDESVRRAGAMDCARFSSNLCPYALGIVDRVTQLLLPNVAGVLPMCSPSDGFVRAELYKLNIYKGPSGFFKKHIDTPRAETQFGSLVLCLPSAHEGGCLTVRHGGLEPVAHDWDVAASAGDVLQWAAFYSDCEHEVNEVTAGRRVTITYNLYYERRVSADPMAGLDSKPAPVDVTRLAPYATMRDLLQNPEWMKDGHTLGIYCAHAYPTTISKVVDLEEPGFNYGRSRTPSPEPLASDKVTTLKGTDMSLYAVFRQLGLEVDLVPIIISSKYLPNQDYGDDEDSKKIFWPCGGTETEPGMVGLTEFITHEGEDAADIPMAFGELVKDVEWITEPLWRNLALIHGNYFGNEAGPPGICYAYTAMIVKIPAAASRGDLVSSA